MSALGFSTICSIWFSKPGYNPARHEGGVMGDRDSDFDEEGQLIGSSDLSMGGWSSVWSPSVCCEHDPQPIVIKIFESVG
jgi:hypothetical protein